MTQREDATPASETSTSLGESLGLCLVTGAAGLLGKNLVEALLARGCRVRALVHKTPLSLEHPNLECMRGDIASAGDVLEACSGVETIFHAAAQIGLLGGSSVTPSYHESALTINVGGTENVIRACQEQAVKRLVYTSSVDVCFDAKPCPKMDRDTPYATRPKSVYAETKIEAEKRVLAANGLGRLTTCAVRSDGIYGPEQNVILDAIVTQLAKGQLSVAIGNASTLQDNSYIDNLVHGELLAAQHLGKGGSACGNAYFITDDTPQNTFEFFRPLIEGLGSKVPTRRIPRGLILPLVTLWEHLHFRLGIGAPPVEPHAIDKITVTHYGSIADATRDLGYRPVKTHAQATEECLPYCRELLDRLRNR